MSDKLEVKEQTATQDYDCVHCEHSIPDETKYVRVAVVRQKNRRRLNKPSATIIEHYHPECWRWVNS